MAKLDPVELTRELIRLDSTNPPGGEAACAELLAGILAPAGFLLKTVEMGPGRVNLLASLPGKPGKKPLCMTGHLDTVPLGGAAWSKDPFAANIEGDRLYGRGSSDMKSGVAAIVAASLELAAAGPGAGGLELVFTADEEVGTTGAVFLGNQPGLLPRAGAMLVAEPTGNQPCLGHKGALWVRAEARGKAAHGSMPQEGDNAVIKLAHLALALHQWDNGDRHPLLGRTTVNVATIKGGSKVNMVPDSASMEVDVRTLPGQSNQSLVEDFAGLALPGTELSIFMDTVSLWTEDDDPFIQMVYDQVEAASGSRPQPAGVSYFTDGSALKPAMGNAPTVVLGPGEAAQAHQTDEYCLVPRIGQAAELFTRIGRAWLEL